MRHLLCAAVLALSWFGFTIDAQSPAPAKRPLTYDVYDAWRSIQGTTLSRDGEWLAYALTANGVDGELVVRNLRTGREFRHPRGTDPVITPDGKFVVFTIVPTKAEDEKFREQERRAGRQGGGQGRGENQPRRTESRNSAGIMTVATGQVAVVERIGTISLPEESSTWVALHRGAGTGGGGRGGRGGRGGAGGRGSGPAAAGQQPQGGAEGEPREGAPRVKRKDPGHDLIVKNLVTGDETTIALVNAFAWNRDGSWLAYGVSSPKAEEDGAFARQMSDWSIHPLLEGKGNYKSLAFDRAGKQLAFLSDQAEYEKDVSPYRLYYWKTGDAQAAELVAAATRGMPAGMVVSDQAPPRFSDDGQRLFLGTAPPPEPPAAEGAAEPRAVDIWHYQDPLLQPMQRVRAQQERNRTYRAVVHLPDKRFVQLGSPDLPSIVAETDPERVVGTSDCRIAGRFPGTRLTTTST